MNFHEFKLSRDIKPDEQAEAMTLKEYYAHQLLLLELGLIDPGMRLWLSAEICYVSQGMKFCQVEPSVIQEIIKSKVQHWTESATETMQAFCLAVGHEITISENRKVESMLVWISKDKPFVWVSATYVQTPGKVDALDIVGHPEEIFDDVEDEDVKTVLKIAFGVSRLIKDRSRTKPVVFLGRVGQRLK